MKVNSQLLADVSAFISLESDMLDHFEYSDWLNLWSETGLYIVPVDHSQKDYKNSLNVAYDDHEMRKMRTERLQSGEAVSTQLSSNTVRTVSRFRILGEEDGIITVRCAYCLYENKNGNIRQYPGDLQYKLRAEDGSFKIEEKVVNIMQSNQHLTTVSYLF